MAESKDSFSPGDIVQFAEGFDGLGTHRMLVESVTDGQVKCLWFSEFREPWEHVFPSNWLVKLAND